MTFPPAQSFHQMTHKSLLSVTSTFNLKKTDLGFNPVKLKISKIFELRNTLLNARSIGSFIFTNDSPKVFLVLLEYGYIVQPTGGSTVMVDLKKYVCKFLVCHL